MTITIKERKNKKLRSEKVQDMVCYLTLIAWPVLQFVIFYFAMNINSFALAFERYRQALSKGRAVGREEL